MAILTTGQLNLPDDVLDPWLGRVQFGSTVATLSKALPMKFGTGASMTFSIGEAEYVGEGAAKGQSDFVPTTITTAPFKFHKTVRWTHEVMWADEDHQMGVLEQILGQIQPALSRALDFGVYHGINPATGERVPTMTTALVNAQNSVTHSDDEAPYRSIDAADALVLADGYLPKDIGLDPEFASKFGGMRSPQTGQKVYPDLSYQTSPAGNLDGHNSSVSNTVQALNVADTASNLLAVVGDFSAVCWGIQRAIGIRVIESGDPDGQGDLQRFNQVAFRAEVVYGWGIADLNAFAKIVKA